MFSDQSESCNYEILFDEEFLGALTLRSSPNRAYPLPASCLLNLSYGKRLFDSEQAQRNAAASHNHRPDQSYASAATGFRGQESHIDNYADNYLRNPRRDSGQQLGHGLVANKVNAKTEHTDSPRGRGMSPGRGRGVSPRRGHGIASSGPSPQQDRSANECNTGARFSFGLFLCVVFVCLFVVVWLGFLISFHPFCLHWKNNCENFTCFFF